MSKLEAMYDAKHAIAVYPNRELHRERRNQPKSYRCTSPNGRPFDFEHFFWDYKSEFTTEEENKNKEIIKSKYCDIIKDIVSFYNSFGGYILFGVSESSMKKIQGCRPDEINHADLLKKIKSTRERYKLLYQQCGSEWNQHWSSVYSATASSNRTTFISKESGSKSRHRKGSICGR